MADKPVTGLAKVVDKLHRIHPVGEHPTKVEYEGQTYRLGESEKYTKQEVLYEHPAKGMNHCADCKHFEAPDGCEIVEGIIQPNDWCKKFEEKKMKKHKFHKTTVEHHKDGSHTIHHHHEDGEQHDVRHAAMGIDHLHDSIQDHLGEPNPGEAAANAGDHGVPADKAAPAGLPMPAAGA